MCLSFWTSCQPTWLSKGDVYFSCLKNVTAVNKRLNKPLVENGLDILIKPIIIIIYLTEIMQKNSRTFAPTFSTFHEFFNSFGVKLHNINFNLSLTDV